jgi:hypothetical protein
MSGGRVFLGLIRAAGATFILRILVAWTRVPRPAGASGTVRPASPCRAGLPARTFQRAAARRPVPARTASDSSDKCRVTGCFWGSSGPRERHLSFESLWPDQGSSAGGRPWNDRVRQPLRGGASSLRSLTGSGSEACPGGTARDSSAKCRVVGCFWGSSGPRERHLSFESLLPGRGALGGRAPVERQGPPALARRRFQLALSNGQRLGGVSRRDRPRFER